MPTTERRIGRYVLLEPVGRGAMGAVYRAEDPAIHRTVAIKLLDTANGMTPKQVALARARFMREAQAAGSIDHPNITRVLDVGEDESSGEMYIVMEFISGASLETMIEEAALDCDHGVELIGQIASGLDAAHAQGIIHRDIKASNILVTDDGIAKIADFGITHVGSSTLTLDMKDLGTPAYMSPEQVGGKAIDHRADLFSLGVVAYEILAGRKPFEGTDIVSIAHAIAYDPPVPISLANPALPRSFDLVFDRILAKEPGDRFPGGKELHEALLACLTDELAGRSVSPTPAIRKRYPAGWGLAAVGPTGDRGLRGRSETGTRHASAREPVAAFRGGVRAFRSCGAVTPDRNTFEAPGASRGGIHSFDEAARSPAARDLGCAAPRAPRGGVAELASVAKAVPAPVPVTVKAKPADLTIRFAHRLRQGTLIVSLDGVPIFDEKFSKSRLTFSQTTVWDPLHAPAGHHTIRARVDGDNGKTYDSDPFAVELPAGQAFALRIAIKGDKLTIGQSTDEADAKP